MTTGEYKKSLGQYPLTDGEIISCLEADRYYGQDDIKAEVFKKRFGDKITGLVLDASDEMEFEFRDRISSLTYDGFLIKGKPDTENYYKYRLRKRGD